MSAAVDFLDINNRKLESASQYLRSAWPLAIASSVDRVRIVDEDHRLSEP